mgnify:CR=1 FL=1
MSAASLAAVAAPLPALDERIVERFLYREARALDEGRYEDWAAMFARDGEYWVPAMWRQPDPINYVSLFYDDRHLMQARINRLRHPGTTTMQPASRTCHQVGNVMVDEEDIRAGTVTVTSNLICVEYRLDEQRTFAGLCRHVLRRAGDGFLILQKRVDLLNCDTDAGHLRVNIPF